MVVPPTDKLDWSNIGFQYRDTNGFVKYTWTNESGWDQGQFVTDPMISIHVCATGLHYGQQCFEGLKAFRDDQDNVHVFRMNMNAKRMQRSADMGFMPSVPEEIFEAGVRRAVAANLEFVPPKSSGGSMYVRPFLFGSGPFIGMGPAPEFSFIVFVTPVSSYYKDGVKPVDALVVDDFDRTAPKGTGAAKLGGNYAPTFKPMFAAKDKGYAITLHLDSRTGTYIDEFSTSNFVALTHPDPTTGKRTFVTPNSSTILESVTRLSLEDIAEKHLGWNVEERPVKFSEVEQGAFAEVAAVGTAAILTPIKRIAKGDNIINIGSGYQTEIGEGFKQLYDVYRGIQDGVLPDKFGWMTLITEDDK